MIVQVSERVRAKATLEMEVDGLAPAGSLTASDGRRLEFAGWTELAVAIEEWRSHDRGANSAEKGRPGGPVNRLPRARPG
jgi:hypothetical protein